MKRFSQRIGVSPAPNAIQLEGISDALKNSIWNYIYALFEEGESGWWNIANHSAQFFFKVPVDELPSYNLRRMEWIKKRLYEMPWHEVYDFVEFVSIWYEKSRDYPRARKAQIQSVLNSIFEAELSGYRFIQGELAPISNPAEVAEIEDALRVTAVNGLAGANAHIATALQLLAKRLDPDFRNSVKESISAVEAIAKQLASSDSQGLGGALSELSKKVPLHGGFRSGLLSLYGYTSDEGGIRHAMLEESNVGYDEAKYMVVTCSAFVNYLAAKASQSGLLGAKK